jgi:hypothetical protein
MYKKTKAWMFEKPSSTIYDNYVIEITNKVLAELYEENNMLRMFKGMAPFQDGISHHQVSSMADEIDYEEEYQYDVIPKGIDANFLMDDDLSKMSIYQTEYNNARVYHQCLIPQSTIEEYY